MGQSQAKQVIKDEEILDYLITQIRKKYKNIRTLYAEQHPALKLNYVASLQLIEKKGKPDFSLQHQRSQQIISSEWVSLDHRALFKGNHSSMKVGNRILIIGEAGTGKSTLCAVIAEDWASGKLFQEFVIVLLLPLNKKDVISAKDLPELIRNVCKFDDDVCSTIGIYLKQNNKDNVLIIADGWNELCESKSQENPFLHHLLFGDVLPSSTLTILVTSRPDSVPQQFNGRLITLQGFNEKAIQSYIQMECSSKQERLHRTIKEFESNPLMGSMCTVPLNLAMICNFCKSHDDLLPSTLPEMYERLAWNLIQLKINSTKKRGRALMLTNYRDLPKELQHPWSHLCEIAFEKCRASSIQAAFALSSKVETFGLLKPVFSGRDEVMFSFLHPTIGHYLAVSHLITMPQSTQLEAIKSMHQVGPMFCRFYLSMNKDVSHDILREVVQKLSKMHHSCNDMCILSYESRNRIVDQEVVESLHTPGTTLKLHSSNAYECEAMIHMLEKIQQKCTVEINFHNSKLKSAQVSRLASTLNSRSRLIQVKGLDLSNNNLDDSIMLDFFRRTVFALGSLEKLFLRSCGIRPEGFGVIVNALTKSCCKSLIELDLSFNSLSVDCLGYLQQYIASDNMKKMEILILKGSFAESVSISFLKIFATTLSLKCNYLRRLDLSANDLGARDNPDLGTIICQLTTSLGKSFDLRLDDRYMSEVENNFLSIMEESIRNKGTIDHIIAHGVIVGPGRSGKNSLMQRLMGERPLAPNQISPSTGVLENIIKVEVKKLSTVASENCNLIWQKLEYDEEALELIMTTAKSYAHVTEIPKQISIKYVTKRKAKPAYDVAISLPPIKCEKKSENAMFEEMASKEPESMNSDVTDSNETPSKHVTVYSSSLAPVDILKKAVKLRRMDALREHLESSWSLYLTNTGGQIEFQEHLPLLVCGPSIFFVTFPLHHDLDQPYEVQYQYPDGSVKRYPSPSTLIDEILQTLATIYTLDCVNIQISGEDVTLKPTVFLIGTHKDCLKAIDKQQKIKEIDQKLQRCVRQTSLFHQHSLQFASDFDSSTESRLMFTVNNLSVNDDDFQKIRFAVQQTVEEKCCREFTVQCPSSWLIFSLVLREKHKLNRVLRLEDAFKIAQECGISSHDELIAALSFIHSRLGLLRYYNVKDLDSLVIVDPQVLFDKITDLIEETFVSKHAHRKEIEDFCEKGIISVAVMKRISERSSKDVQLPLTWLTKVLNHLRLAALFKDHDEEKYFFPSALCHAATAQDSSVKSTVHTNLASALIAFETGFCPRGTAGALIKCLMTNEMKSAKRWELLPSKIFRNQVSFYIEDCGDMTIKVLPTHLEFAIDSAEITEIDCCESEIHEEVYTQTAKCMKIVTNLYKKYQFYWTFYCTLAECQTHPHPAVIEWNRHNAPSRLRCKVFNKSVVLPRGYKLWNILREGERPLCSAEVQFRHLGQIADSMVEWEGLIADELELTPSDVADIKTKYPQRLKLQSREALHIWIQRNGSKATYSRLINVFEQAGYRNYADLVRRIVDVSNKDSSGSGEEQCQPNTYPQYKEQQVLSQLPQATPESTEIYMVVEESLTEGGQLCSEMEVLESRNVTKSFVPKLDVMSDQDDSQTDEEHSSKVDVSVTDQSGSRSTLLKDKITTDSVGPLAEKKYMFTTSRVIGRWFHPNITGQQAEELLISRGRDGSFLCRPNMTIPGDFTLSVRCSDDVKHIKIQNAGDYYDLHGGEKFATLGELVGFYWDNPGTLRERNGKVIMLKLPVNREKDTTERWFHSSLTGREAEALLLAKGQDGSYLIHPSVHNPGNFDLSVRVDERVSHVMIRNRDDHFDVGGGPKFGSLTELVEYYKKNPMVETNGTVINLKVPFNTTSFPAADIQTRIAQLQKMHQDDIVYGKSGFWEEFEQLQQQECKHLYSRREGARPENKPKNRYKNILPFDHTRVALKIDIGDGPGADYINANYISGEVPGSERKYIATQGCLPGTVLDFWKMIWQENTLIIIMTINEVVRGRSKCIRYWPEIEQNKVYSHIHVTNLKETVNRHYILREFLAHHDCEDSEGRHIYQFHFKAWPDHGVPHDPGIVLHFLSDVTLKQNTLASEGISPGPIVVHCSAGLGQTGIFIVIDILISLITYQGWDDEIDIQNTIQLMRAQRCGMIPTELQYKFVYQAILAYVESQQALMGVG